MKRNIPRGQLTDYTTVVWTLETPPCLMFSSESEMVVHHNHQMASKTTVSMKNEMREKKLTQALISTSCGNILMFFIPTLTWIIHLFSCFCRTLLHCPSPITINALTKILILRFSSSQVLMSNWSCAFHF